MKYIPTQLYFAFCYLETGNYLNNFIIKRDLQNKKLRFGPLLISPSEDIIQKNIVPANISNEIKKKIIMSAKKLFQTLCLKNYARIDFFLTIDNKLYFNEVNSLPGFYKKSLFSQLWTDYQYIDIILLIINNSFFQQIKKNIL